MISTPQTTTVIDSSFGTNGSRYLFLHRSHYRHLLTDLHQANGPLTTDNVFDYFATSMFYDKQSNNQVLRMQTMHTGMPILNEAEELKLVISQTFPRIH